MQPTMIIQINQMIQSSYNMKNMTNCDKNSKNPNRPALLIPTTISTKSEIIGINTHTSINYSPIKSKPNHPKSQSECSMRSLTTKQPNYISEPISRNTDKGLNHSA